MRTTSFREIVESGRVRSARALCTRASGARGIASFFRVALPVALSVAVASVLILGASPVRAQSPPLEAFFTSGARVATTAENGESWSPNDVCRPPIHGSMLDGGSGTAHRGGVTDNDAAHYARGSVMVVLVFVDHDGGSWDPAGRDEQAAKAADAKQYYLDRVPNEAFVT
ncbi:MAG: hypothetical protein KC729_18335, partial [Candidatus Eisenbacteria bacterium]|nr:hypothetical protein [Candidatus Eisenbacteria bacterium]